MMPLAIFFAGLNSIQYLYINNYLTVVQTVDKSSDPRVSIVMSRSLQSIQNVLYSSCYVMFHQSDRSNR